MHRAQQHVRRFPWYAKLDMKGYFASIDHGILKAKLRRRLRSKPLMTLLDRIIDSNQTVPGRGSPIGSLLSQSFANFYLNAFDRFLLETERVDGLVRYMDDVLIWASSRNRIKDIVARSQDFLQTELRLTLKATLQINRSSRGVTVCGYRVHAGTILLAKSRKLRFRAARMHWEREYREGRIGASELQRGIDSALSIIAHASTRTWRKRQFPTGTPHGAILPVEYLSGNGSIAASTV